jgi:hypothetical protein
VARKTSTYLQRQCNTLGMEYQLIALSDPYELEIATGGCKQTFTFTRNGINCNKVWSWMVQKLIDTDLEQAQIPLSQIYYVKSCDWSQIQYHCQEPVMHVVSHHFEEYW